MNYFLKDLKEHLKKLRVHVGKNKKPLLEKGVPDSNFECHHTDDIFNNLFPYNWYFEAYYDENYIAWSEYGHNKNLPPEQRSEETSVPFLIKSEVDFIKNPKRRERLFKLKLDLLDYLISAKEFNITQIAKITHSYLSYQEFTEINDISKKYSDEVSKFETDISQKFKKGKATILSYRDKVLDVKGPVKLNQIAESFLEKDKIYTNSSGGLDQLLTFMSIIIFESNVSTLNSTYCRIKEQYDSFGDALDVIIKAYFTSTNAWNKFMINQVEDTSLHSELFNYASRERDRITQYLLPQASIILDNIGETLYRLDKEKQAKDDSEIRVGKDYNNLIIDFTGPENISIEYQGKTLSKNRTEKPPFGDESPFIHKQSKDKHTALWLHLFNICTNKRITDTSNAAKIKRDMEKALKCYFHMTHSIFKTENANSTLKALFECRASTFVKYDEVKKKLISRNAHSWS